MIKIPFNNSYIDLGDDFYVKTMPTPVPQPELIVFNEVFAEELGLADAKLDSTEAIAFFAGNLIAEGSEPLAMAYAGHQFGGFSPQLGDGRALQLGEMLSPEGVRFDIQLKGSGSTYFSRSGDGRSALGPVLREYLVSEAMAKLAVPTTRALAAVTTGERVARMELVPGGILTRVATSFVRVGTFQYFSSNGDEASVKKLADYVIERNYLPTHPQMQEADNPYEAFLKAVIDRQAALIAQWMQLGFIHGVMNTDNMSVAGETIDYGPCAFMDDFSHDRVFSSIDRQGRYAYGNQPSMGQWNLVRLAECLLPFLGNGEGNSEEDAEATVKIAQDALNEFVPLYRGYWLAGMRSKLGLVQKEEDDKDLIEELLDLMASNKADFTLTFYYLSLLSMAPSEDDADIRTLFAESGSEPELVDAWLVKWRERLLVEKADDAERQANMQSVNPVYIPRNHQIEAAIRAAEDHHDFSVFHALNKVLQNPYTVQEGCEAYSLPPLPEEVVQQTFCGT